MMIPVKTMLGGYDIVFEKGALSRIEEILNLDRKVLVVTDDGVPREYAVSVADKCENGIVIVLPQGEASKNFDNYRKILDALCECEFSRSDCVVAVGGGVVGDMAGFATATYMRGIEFYNIPTTVLSQVDSSVGGKTAIDFNGIKNIVGCFYQPSRVVIDTSLLKTLPARQISNGLAESLKMALTHSEELFSIFENGNIADSLDEIIEKSILIKREVVQSDEKESGLRRVLNFGHTVGHAIESNSPHLYHGECVALGMLPMCSPSVKERVLPIINKLNLPHEIEIEEEKLIEKMRLDKKVSGQDITVVTVEEIGTFNLDKIPFSLLEEKIKGVYA